MAQWKYPWQAREAARKKEPKPIARRTKEGEKEDREYLKRRAKYLQEHPVCQCGAIGCTGVATEIHHRKGRGIWLLVVKFFLAVCRHCHDKIEAEPAWAKENGYSLDRVE